MTTSEDEVRDELTAWLDATEPPFDPTTASVRRRARTRRRRQSVAVSVGCVVAVGAVVVGGQLGGARSSAPVEPSAPDRESFSPSDYEATMIRLARGETDPYPPRASSAVEAHDGQGQVIRGDDRRFASWWRGSFLLEEGHALTIAVADDETDPPGGDRAEFLQRECDGELGLANERDALLSCEVEALPAGGSLQYVERAAYPLDGGWAVPHPAMKLGKRGEAALDWYVQEVRVQRSAYPLTVTEAVQAPSIEEARTRFEYTRAELTTAALDDGLRFPSPPRNDQGCTWTLASQDGPGACTMIRRPEVERRFHAVDYQEVIDAVGAYYGDRSYGGVYPDEEDARVTIRWAGEVPAPIADLVADPPDGISVVVYPIAFTAAQLEEAGRALLAAEPSELRGNRVLSYEPSGDPGLLAVTMARPWRGSTLILEEIAGVPVYPSLR